MKNLLSATLVILLTLAFGTASAQLSNRVILKLKKQLVVTDRSTSTKFTGNVAIDKISLQYGATKVKAHRLGQKSKEYMYVIEFPNADNIHEIVKAYNATGEVEYAEPDYIGKVQGVTPNDTLYHKQWDMKNDGSFSLLPAKAGADIDMEEAWGITQGDTNIIVAVIDAGLLLGHPEFEGRVWHNKDEIPNNNIDEDGNGFMDDYQGWNFAYANNDPGDDQGHGTNVTSILGANGNNTAYYAGVNWHCKLMVLKGIDSSGTGTYSWWADAIYYAVDKGARVISMSLAGVAQSTPFQNAVNYALNSGVIIVAAEGNYNSEDPVYPASFTGVIAVGATNPDDSRVVPFFWDTLTGSSYGNNITVMAPGNYIYGISIPKDTLPYMGGTSQATPHVTGLVSLLLTLNPTLTREQVRDILITTAEDEIGPESEDKPGYDKYFGWGRINAYRALQYLTVGINATEKDKTLSIFPNPSNKSFTVQLPADAKEVYILNSMGALVHSEDVKGEQRKNFHLLNSGMYFVQVQTSNGFISEKVLVCN